MKVAVPHLPGRGTATGAPPGQGRGIFYGWYMVGAGFTADMVNAGVGGYLLGVMMVPMQEALHTSRTMISLALTLRGLVSSVASPFVGPLVDRRGGARWVMFAGGLFGGLGLVLAGLASTPWHFLVAYGVIGGIGTLASGQLVTSVLLAKWFIRLRGRATAIASMGVSTGGLVMVPLAAALMAALEWRGVWVVVGVVVWALILPVALLVVRTRPEEMGLLPDGERPGGVAGPAMGGRSPWAAEVQWTRGEALRSPTLWLLIVAFNLGGAELSGIMLHQKAYLEEHGLTGAQAAAAFTAFAAAAFAGKPVWGYIIDRVSTHALLVSIYVFESMAIAVFLPVHDPATGFAAAISFGLAVSGIATIQSVVWANYYGRGFLGAIRGLVTPFHLLASAGGPVMAAAVHDATDSYTIPFLLFLLFAVGAAVIALVARPPVKRAAGGHAMAP